MATSDIFVVVIVVTGLNRVPDKDWSFRQKREPRPSTPSQGILVVVTGNFLHEHHDPAPQGGIINSRTLRSALSRPDRRRSHQSGPSIARFHWSRVALKRSARLRRRMLLAPEGYG